MSSTVGACARCPDKGVPLEFCETCRKWLCAPCYAAHQHKDARPSIFDLLPYLGLLALLHCGVPPPSLEGEFDIRLQFVDGGMAYCQGYYGQLYEATGKMEMHQDGQDVLSGQYELCQGLVMGNDFGGRRENGLQFYGWLPKAPLLLHDGAVWTVPSGSFWRAPAVAPEFDDLVLLGERPSDGSGKSLPPDPKNGDAFVRFSNGGK